MTHAAPTLADFHALDDEIRTATSLFAIVTGRRGLDEAQRTDHLRRIATSGSSLAAPTLVIELARGTPLTAERAWVEQVIAIVAAAPRLDGIAPRLEHRFLIVGAPGEAPMLEPAMVAAVLDGEAANLQELERRMPDLIARAAALSAALAD
jgi:hypothetical protein